MKFNEMGVASPGYLVFPKIKPKSKDISKRIIQNAKYLCVKKISIEGAALYIDDVLIFTTSGENSKYYSIRRNGRMDYIVSKIGIHILLSSGYIVKS